MRAFELQSSFGLNNLVCVEQASIQLGPDEVRVAVAATSLNYRDLLMVEGNYNPRQPLPLIPCSDAAGVVTEIGSEVSKFKVGDQVCSTFFTRFESGAISPDAAASSRGGPEQGVLQEEFVSSVNALVAAPTHLTLEQSSTLPCAALTAWNALFEEGSLTADDTVLIQGTGGVSMFAFQFAKAVGAKVIATTSSDEKKRWLEDLGADAVINYREDETWGRSVKKLTDKRGVDYIVEVGGAGTFTQSLNAIATGGTIALIGVLSGVEQPLNIIPILMRHIRIQGILVGNRSAFERMNAFMTTHKIEPMVGDCFEFDDAVAAFEHLKHARHRGKIVIQTA